MDSLFCYFKSPAIGYIAEKSGCIAEESGCIAEKFGCIAEKIGCIAEKFGCIAEKSGCIAEKFGYIAGMFHPYIYLNSISLVCYISAEVKKRLINIISEDSLIFFYKIL